MTQHDLTGETFNPWGGYYSYIVVNFTSDGSKNKRGFFIRFHSGTNRLLNYAKIQIKIDDI